MSKVHPVDGAEDGRDNPSFDKNEDNGEPRGTPTEGDHDSKKPPSESDDSTVVEMEPGANGESNEKSVEAGVNEPEVAVFGVGGNEQSSGPAVKPYAGMGKEDLLRFSETDFWKRARLISILLFWAAWLALLGAVIGLTIVAPRCASQPSPAWWQRSVVYQIYVRSFYDNITNGVGDIDGIIEKLPYLQDLEVDAILLSSLLQSNQTQGADYGYEITSYTDIDSTLGSLENFHALINASHTAGIKVLMDFVPNHSGLGHPWFTESQSSASVTNPKWNYYVWANCSDGSIPPNNWLSVYDASAWTYDVTREQCYLHQFLPTQPDLNLRSTAVQQELEEVLHYWLQLGVDGFRVVNTAYLFESLDLQNEIFNSTCTSGNRYDCLSHTYTRALPESYDIIRRWRLIVDSYTETSDSPRVLLTDADIEIHKATQYYGDKYGLSGSNLAINYGLATLLNKSADTLTGRHLQSLVQDWVDSMPSGATPNWLTGDQDRSRVERYHEVFNLLKFTLPGTAFIYYGEEIGMTNVDVSSSAEQDPAGQAFSRYEYRTPMQWNNTDYGGFTLGTSSWLPLGNISINVVDQDSVDSSALSLVKKLIKLRRAEGSLKYGATHILWADDKLFSFVREHEGNKRVMVAVNVGSSASDEVNFTQQNVFSVPNEGTVAVVTHPSTMPNVGDKVDLRKLKLEPSQGIVVTWDYSRPFP